MKESLKKNKGLLIITVVFSILSSASGVFTAIVLQKITDVTLNKDMNGFIKVLAATVIYVAVFGVLYFIYSIASKKLIRNVTQQLRARVFDGVMRRGYEDFHSVNSADYISALTNDIKMVEENYILLLLLILQYAVTFIASLILLIVLSPVVTLCLAVCLVLMYTIPSLFGKILQSRQDALSSRFSDFTTKLKDILSGYEVIKSYHITGAVTNEFNQENNGTADAKYTADRLFVINESLSQMLAILTQVATIFLAAYLVFRGSLTMGTLIALVQLGGSIVWPIVTIMQSMPKIKSIDPVVKRLEEYMTYEDVSFTGTKEPSFEHELAVNNLNFSYDPAQSVLKDASLTIEKGKKYAIVGGSGCGKTTLIKLITACYSKYQGDIAFDGEDLRNLDSDRLKQMISLIHQDVYMFDKSIQENICLYKEFTIEEQQRAFEMSGMDSFLSKMPEGVLTMVGENGSNLSGGQRQRVAIARALIQKTPILILDEGTSAIDMQTAYDIESRLLEIQELTLLTITHKMSAELLGKYDSIIYMESGTIKEMGSFDQLYNRKESFYRFFTLQE